MGFRLLGKGRQRLWLSEWGSDCWVKGDRGCGGLNGCSDCWVKGDRVCGCLNGVQTVG